MTSIWAVRALATGAALAGWASFVPAYGQVAQEVTTLGEHSITLNLHPFLSEEDLTVLRFIATEPQALAMFITTEGGYAAIAVSPDEGFVKDGAPMPSVGALGGLPDAETAATNATAACQALAKTPTACEVVLQIAPK